MKITRRQLRQLIQEAMSVESDKDIDKKIHNAALELLRDNPDFEYDDCYDEAAEHLGYQDWNEQQKAEYARKANAAYEKKKASQPEIDRMLRQRLENDPMYQKRMRHEQPYSKDF